MSKRVSITAYFIAALSLLALPLQAAAPNPYDFNVYTIGSIGTSTNAFNGGDIKGIVGSGGNTYVSSITINSNGFSSPYSAYSGGVFSLNSGTIYNGGSQAAGNTIYRSSVVNGNVNGGAGLQGSGGNIFGNVSITGSNTSTVGVSGTVSTGQAFSSVVNFPSVSSYFQGASSYWGSLSPTATVTNYYGQLQLNSLTSGRNVVNLTLAQLSSSYGILLNGPSSAFVIFNITDATPTAQLLKDVTFALTGGISSTNVIFNLVNATQLTLQGAQYLSILAPNATINMLGSSKVTGNLIANNLTGNGSAYTGTFTGFQIDQANFVAVPEPATYAILLSLIGFIVLNQKFRKKAIVRL